MEILNFDNDIKVFYVTASSFPDGIMAAHEKVHSMVPFSTERRYLGISRPENDQGIVYRAAVEELYDDEAKTLGLDSLTLKKGRYISLAINDYMSDIQSVQRAFDELLEQPGLDPQGYCVEHYINDKDMICMVRLEK